MTDPVAHLNAALDGRYRIERELGRGGMATVYLARDLRHGRGVALKVLKPELTAAIGADRFLAEIETTAQLQHPHILPLFDSGQADGVLFYVMPYIEGESLRQRLDRDTQLPVDEAVRIAVGVASALQAAHDQGVIHRDVKPANILLSRGEPLVADFGIALALGDLVDRGRLTETGQSLGTPHYMSPEQATGEQRLGPPTDVYTLGCVTYEMLTGEPPFTGSSAQVILGKIIQDPPVTASRVRPAVPPNVDGAIRKALEKLPADRFPRVEDFSRALTDPGFRHGEAGLSEAGARRWTVGFSGAAVIAGLAFAAGVGLVSMRGQSGSNGATPYAPTVRFRIDGDFGNAQGRVVAISPNGRRIAHSTTTTPLVVRSLDRSDVPVEVHETGKQPFFSPDGEWVAFFSGGGALTKVPATGGAPRMITPMPFRAFGGSWGADGTIVFATTEGLTRVHEDGGTAELLAAPDPEQGELYYAWPEVLGDGRAVLYTIVPRGANADSEGQIAVLDLATGTSTVLLRGGSGARYVASGHLLYSSGGELHAISFDPERLSVFGDPVSASVPGLQVVRGLGPDFDVSLTGTLLYTPAGAPSEERTLVWVDRQGSADTLPVPQGRYVYPRISPAGDRVAVDVTFAEGGRNVHVFDVDRGTLTRLTRDPAEELLAYWSPDGRRIYFSSNRRGPFDVLWRSSDGTGPAEAVTAGTESLFVMSGTPLGDRLVANRISPGDPDVDIVSLSVEPGSGYTVLIATPDWEGMATISHDGRWMAYVSDASGGEEVYVAPYPEAGRERTRVSVEGGLFPLWSPDDRQLFFKAPSGPLMVAEVDPGPPFRVGTVAEALPPVAPVPMELGARSFDISPRDGRFLMTRPVEAGEDPGIVVVLNWLKELEQRLPAR